MKKYPENIDDIGAFYREGLSDAVIDPPLGIKVSISNTLDSTTTNDIGQEIKSSFDGITEVPAASLKTNLFNALDAQTTKPKLKKGSTKYFVGGSFLIVATLLTIVYWPRSEVIINDSTPIKNTFEKHLEPEVNDVPNNDLLNEEPELINKNSVIPVKQEKESASKVLTEEKNQFKISDSEDQELIIEEYDIIQDPVLDDLINESKKVDVEDIIDEPNDHSELIDESDDSNGNTIWKKNKRKKN